ncbi:MAG: GntR family transcriptional regulator [Proteocatella sp.]
MAWDFEQDKPIYIQIVNKIKLGILSGSYKPGDRLESVRELASIAGVNPNTMQKALQELENIELVYSQRTSGRFITDNDVIIDNLRKKVAGEKIIAFIENMLNLGFTKEEIENMIKEYLAEGESAFKINEISTKDSKKSKAVGNLEDLLKEGDL